MDGPQKAWVGSILAAVVAFLSVVGGALGESRTLSDLTAQTWVNAILAALTALPIVGGSVWVTTNKKNDG